MSPILIVVAVIFNFFVLYQIYFYLKSKKSVGNKIPFDKIDSSLVEKIRDKKGLLYFHSPTCHNCKTQTPIIESIKKLNNSILSVDISENQQMARSFNVMGTPSIIFFSGNKIKGYYVGVKNETFILEKLSNN